VFLVLAAFFLVVGVVYWFLAYEIAGTVMFGLWCLTLLFAALFLEAEAKQQVPPGDDPDLRPEERAGEPIGVFARASGWPVVLAAGLTVGLAGLVYGAWLFIPGAVVTIAALLGLLRETAAA
jgi:hypothetical protein